MLGKTLTEAIASAASLFSVNVTEFFWEYMHLNYSSEVTRTERVRCGKRNICTPHICQIHLTYPQTQSVGKLKIAIDYSVFACVCSIQKSYGRQRQLAHTAERFNDEQNMSSGIIPYIHSALGEHTVNNPKSHTRNINEILERGKIHKPMSFFHPAWRLTCSAALIEFVL